MPQRVFSLPIGANYRRKMKLSHLSLPYCLGFLGTNALASSYTINIPKKEGIKISCHHHEEHYQTSLPIPTQFLGELMRLILTEYTIGVEWQYHYPFFPSVPSGKYIVIIGDFNIDLLKCASSSYSHNFLSSLQSFFLVLTIDKPTRVHSTSATLIDNIFINNHD